MKLVLDRFKDNGKATIGMMLVDGEFECFTVEDTYREVKIKGETCIPAGEYEIKLRNEGGMTGRYAKKYPFHKGMLHLQNVPNFKYVYIHTGNNASHTEGCILLNAGVDSERMTGSKSRVAYVKMYHKVLKALANNETVTIKIG